MRFDRIPRGTGGYRSRSAMFRNSSTDSPAAVIAFPWASDMAATAAATLPSSTATPVPDLVLRSRASKPRSTVAATCSTPSSKWTASVRRSLAETEAAARAAPPVRGFAEALRAKIAAGEFALIGEIPKHP